jgi:hypothetical protein
LSHHRTESLSVNLILPIAAFLLALTVALHPIRDRLEGRNPRSARESDFALVIYYPVRAFLDGSNPYDRSSYLAQYSVRAAFGPYLPGILLLHLPFGFMSVERAQSFYLVTSICLTLVLAFLSLKFSMVKVSIPAVLLLGAVIVLTRPGRQTLLLGQVTLEVVLTTYVTLYCAPSAPGLSGLALALTLLKPNYGLPLALLLLIQGHLRSLAYAAFCVLLLNMPVVAILADRAGGIHPLFEQFASSAVDFESMSSASPTISPYRVDAVALIGRLVGHAPDLAGHLLVTLTVLGLAGFVSRGLPNHHHSFGLLAGLVCTAVLLSGYHPAYDLLLLTLPFVWVAHRGSLVVGTPSTRLILLLFAFLAFNYAASDSVFRRFGLLAVSDAGWKALVRDPRALALASLNGLALLCVFCSLVVASLTPPTLLSIPGATGCTGRTGS